MNNYVPSSVNANVSRERERDLKKGKSSHANASNRFHNSQIHTVELVSARRWAQGKTKREKQMEVFDCVHLVCRVASMFNLFCLAKNAAGE